MPGSVNVSIRWTRPAGPVSLSTGIGNATALGLTTGVGGSSAPVITTASLPGGTVGSAYSQTLTKTGTAPITWSITSGSISPLTLNSSTGAITGTPSTATTLSATFRATNAYGFDEDPLSIVVGAAGGPVLITAPSITVWRAA